MGFVLGAIAVIAVLLLLVNSGAKTAHSGRQISKIRDSEYGNYILDKLIRDYPSLNNPREKYVACAICGDSVSRYMLHHSFAIEIAKPKQADRKLNIYCYEHAKPQLDEYKKKLSHAEFIKIIDEANMLNVALKG